MIRMKHKHYPIWINWDGDENTFSKVKQFILEDIAEAGFGRFEAMQDTVRGEASEASVDEEQWDNHIKAAGRTPRPSSSKKTNRTEPKPPKKAKGKTLGDSTTKSGI